MAGIRGLSEHTSLNPNCPLAMAARRLATLTPTVPPLTALISSRMFGLFSGWVVPTKKLDCWSLPHICREGTHQPGLSSMQVWGQVIQPGHNRALRRQLCTHFAGQ